MILVFLIVILFSIPLFFAFRYRSFIESFLSPNQEISNILILGKGGVGHEAPDLTDTIIVASVSSNRIKLISLPRDIWVPEIRAKLNSAYYWGKQKDQGFKIADESVTRIAGQNIDYNVVVDFSIFKSIVDSLGGIEVEVENEFTDQKYPIAGLENDLCNGDKTFACRYETIKFEKGKQIMDGETALKFVRSRNAQGDEGTDFAREERQQLVISAIKNKTLSSEVLLNPLKIKFLWEATLNSIETDIPQEILGELTRKAFDSRNNVGSVVIPEEMLINPPISLKYDRQYVFIPKTGSWSEVQKWIKSVFN